MARHIGTHFSPFQRPRTTKSKKSINPIRGMNIVGFIAEITTRLGLNWLSHTLSSSFIVKSKRKMIELIAISKPPIIARKVACHGRVIFFITSIVAKVSFFVKKDLKKHRFWGIIL